MMKASTLMFDAKTGFLTKIKRRDHRLQRLEELNEKLSQENKDLRELYEKKLSQLEHDNELLRTGLIVDSIGYQLGHIKPMRPMGV